jgi:MGT family glycosyltransferase
MARFLMWTGSAPGHVTPCVPIARRLVERGHEVVWITGRQFQTKVEAAGATFRPCPKELDPEGMDVYEFRPGLKARKGLRQVRYWIKHVFLDACACAIECTNAVLAEFPADVVIGDSVAFGLGFKAERDGMAVVNISLLPLSLPSRDVAPWGMGILPGKTRLARARIRMLNYLVYHLLLRDITVYANRIRRTLGLDPFHRPFFEAMFAKRSLILHISTPAFEYPRSDQPGSLHFIGPILPEPDPAFQPPPWWDELNGTRPTVLVNQGTIAKNLNDLIVPAIRALENQDVLVVAVPVEKGRLGDLPDHVHAEPFLCFGHLLPHVDVMVTNGGYGGTQRALAQGIPMVVAGETEDKMEVAARVEWAGAGINLRRRRPSPESIREAVNEVLTNPVYRANAKRIQADFAKYDAPTVAAELLEALARGERPRKGSIS